MRSASQHSFAVAPQAAIPRSSFNRNMTYKTTFDGGYLYPIFVDEALPGDTFNLKLTSFARLATPLSYPIMDNMYMDFQFFFVPLRLLWSNFEKMMGATDGTASGDQTGDTDYLAPTITSPATTGWAVGSLSDYFGLPTGIPNVKVNSFAHRAYNKIYNDWYRDENLIDPIPENVDDGPDDNDDYLLKKRGKRKDYATGALPWPQKGPGVELPLGTTAPVVGTGILGLTNGTDQYGFGNTAGSLVSLAKQKTVGTESVGQTFNALNENTGYLGVSSNPDRSGLVADLSSATAATINSLRQAFQIQKLYERDARGGTRYVEILQSHFGVTSPDARLQRPEFLGGGSVPIQIHTVTNNAGSSGENYQGQLAAYGVTAQNNVGFVKSFVEHGIVMGLVSVRADLTYQQGTPRMFSRMSRFDWYWPALAHLGEQAILNKEIYTQGNEDDDKVFGYQERFAEYRYGVSKITGQLRSTYDQSLDAWHLSQHFENLPTLNQTFIEENPPIDRVLAVTSGPQFIYDSLISLNCVRPMPVFSVPGMADHF